MENFSTVVQTCPSSSHHFFQHPHQNFTIYKQSSVQAMGLNCYDNAQSRAVSHYNESATRAVAVAMVRSVIPINEGDGMPRLANQESAASSNNPNPNAISINQGNAVTNFGNQHPVDCNYNNQHQRNYQSGKIMPQYSEDEVMPNITRIEVAKVQPSPKIEMPAVRTNPEDFPGPLSFRLFINRENDRKKSFVFSKMLGKVFISMKKTLPVQFSWQNYPSNLRVRACMVFKDGHSRAKPVQRCLAHKANDLKENELVEPLQLKFTFLTNQWGSFYQENAKGFLSIVTPAGPPNPGHDYFQVDYQYFCMTSCVSGMNRRATFLVFTLENENGYIFGRQSLPIQICSCPKRDMEKEEERALDPTGEKKIMKLRKTEKIQHPASFMPQLTCLYKAALNNLQPMSYVPQITSYLRQPTLNFPQSMMSYPKKDEVFDLNIKILGAAEYLGVLEFSYRLLLRDGHDNNKLDKHLEMLNVIKRKIDEFQRANSTL